MEQKTFLFENTSSTYYSAKIILECIWEYLGNPKSVLDLGCGAGGFIKAFEDKGVTDYHLFDHPSLNLDMLLIERKDRFVPVDLDRIAPTPIKVDVAICTEVLEHLAPTRSEEIVRFLAESAEIIVFSAAVPRQGGLGHINEQWHNHWHTVFSKYGFTYFDGFKPFLISDERVHYWLIQNLFIYVRKDKASRMDWPPNISNGRFQIVSNYVLEKKYGVRESFHLLTTALYNYFKRDKNG